VFLRQVTGSSEIHSLNEIKENFIFAGLKINNNQAMQLTKQRKEDIITGFGGSVANTGSTEAQIALLTERINHISSHIDGQKKDFNTSRSLLKLVGQRKRLLKYLQHINLSSYRTIIEKLNLRK
jgi:small subunit ribosomal protein S15